MNKDKQTSMESFEQCIKCTVCTVYCPMVAVNPDYPGPKQAGPDGERYRLKNPMFYDDALDLCLNCKRCEVACPSNVKIGDLIQNARLKYSARKPGLRDYMLANTDVMGSMATTFAPIVNGMLGLKPVKKVMDKTLAIDHHRTLPKYSAQKFETWFRRKARKSQEAFPEKVSYFHGCYANYNNPKLAKDFVKIMNALGYGVNLLEKEKCCGVALISNGFKEKALKQAELNLRSIRKAVSRGEMVLTTSSTCTFTMRDEYAHILGLDNSDVRGSIALATKFIYELVDLGKARLVFKKDYVKRIAYHTPCHMEKLGWAVYSTSLLRMIPGVDFNMLDSQCCGIAGTYGFKKEHYNDSQKIGESLFRQIADLNVDVVSTDCETCKWQIEMSTGVPVENPISIIADALDVEATIKANQKK
ncbi:MAG: anaerobic glycerol-3-phosphate dehydrogenase subunit C [Bacteroidales bacterium]|nr:anaerobic glycerol-3-phosphate dehydrogenase subunit C [Bacteroidales bacterium]